MVAEDLADNSVTTNNIVNNAVTGDKIDLTKGASTVDQAPSVGTNGKIDVNVDGKTVNVNNSNELYVDTATLVLEVGDQLAGEGLTFNTKSGALDVNAGNGIEVVNNQVQAVAGDSSIIVDTSGIKANVDGQTIETGPNGLQLREGGVDTKHFKDGAGLAEKQNGPALKNVGLF